MHYGQDNKDENEYDDRRWIDESMVMTQWTTWLTLTTLLNCLSLNPPEEEIGSSAYRPRVPSSLEVHSMLLRGHFEGDMARTMETMFEP
jgi:hypothetical protein